MTNKRRGRGSEDRDALSTSKPIMETRDDLKAMAESVETLTIRLERLEYLAGSYNHGEKTDGSSLVAQVDELQLMVDQIFASQESLTPTVKNIYGMLLHSY